MFFSTFPTFFDVFPIAFHGSSPEFLRVLPIEPGSLVTFLLSGFLDVFMITFLTCGAVSLASLVVGINSFPRQTYYQILYYQTNI